jgi:hypothetical protein
MYFAYDDIKVQVSELSISIHHRSSYGRYFGTINIRKF